MQQHGNFVLSSDPNMFAKLFPHLFPFGYGRSGIDIKVNASLEQCVKHYLCLSRRNFAQDCTFPLIAFDTVTRKKAMSQVALMCKLSPGEFPRMTA